MRYLLAVSLAIAWLTGNAQNSGSSAKTARPKLVVGIVVDQMRWDFLYRYYDRYSAGGFKRLMNEGFNCENAMIPYTPTYTAAGHACVYTGSVPAVHGIMGNNWYDKTLGRNVYCTEDSTVQSVGTTSAAGKMSPVNMWTTTISDEMRIATNFRSKVIGVAFKDRGSILPAGHSANAAYWFDDATGGFITSSYYMNDLPQWVKDFNNKKLPDAYLQKNWNTLYPLNTYRQSTRDSVPYESVLPKEDNTFPHITSTITNNRYNSFRYTPYANTFTLDMAKAAVIAENLGRSGETDILAISFSSTDYMGHEFGPNSIEIEDTYLRLDADIASFLDFLDKTVGKNQYTVFLTADHGVANVPGFLKEHKIPAGTFDDAEISKQLNVFIENRYNLKNAISRIINYQVYFNDAVVNEQVKPEVTRATIRQLLTYPFIANAFELSNMFSVPVPGKLRDMMANGYNVKLSGDIQINYKPQWYDGWAKGTSH
ncbi:MAG: nucleotide pyrophosphatase, partial [Chitinophagaceae bacterium]|nr:nucleotide pyrophosphatase [Chitinophagaceae bacterium]